MGRRLSASGRSSEVRRIRGAWVDVGREQARALGCPGRDRNVICAREQPESITPPVAGLTALRSASAFGSRIRGVAPSHRSCLPQAPERPGAASVYFPHEIRAGIRQLRPQRQLRRRKGAVPVPADGDPLRAPGHAGGDEIVSREDVHRLREALDAVSLDEVRDVRFDGTCEDLFFYVEGLLVASCGDDVAGRLHTARSRNDIDMTMYRMRQREFVLDWWRRCSTLRASLLDLASQHRDTVMAAHTHTQPAQPSTIAHYLLAMIEQLERDTDAPARLVSDDQPQPAGCVRHHRYRVPDRPRASPASCSASTGRPATPTAASPRSTTCSRAPTPPPSPWAGSGVSCRTFCCGARRK